MVQFVTLPSLLFMGGLLSETLCSVILEAESGENVTMWCKHEVAVTGSIFWYKHTSDSVPLLLECVNFYASSPSENCMFFTESERTVMSVEEKKTSLSITAVNVSDTGLYYCSFMKQVRMSFGDSTSLHVKGGYKRIRAEGCVCSDVFFKMTVVFGVVIVILFGVSISLILKQRKTHGGDYNGRHNDEEQQPDSVNYAALQFSKKKIRKTGRHSEMVDPHVVYSSVR